MTPYFQRGGITIFHGDCRDILEHVSADAIVTDPPYGITDHSWDVVVPADQWMTAPVAVVTASEPYATSLITSSPLRFAFDLVWVKNCVTNAFNAKRQPMRRHERVLVFGAYEWHPEKRERSQEEMKRLNRKQRQTMRFANPDSVLTFNAVNNRSSERTAHPSQKPVGLMSRLIGDLTSGIVCDPFAGSGSTLVAAQMLGRSAIGIESNEAFCEISARRIESLLTEAA